MNELTNPRKKFGPSSFHAKFVDDMTIAEAFNIKEAVVDNHDRQLPDPYHAMLGLKLKTEKTLVYNKIREIHEYSETNEMKLNLTKTKFMLFNPTKNWDFIPIFTLGNTEIETQEEMKMLGLIVRNDLTWKSNTDTMTQKAYSRLWILKRLKKQGANLEDLKDIYIKQVLSVLEFGALDSPKRKL